MKYDTLSPYALAADLWPDVYFDSDERKIIDSVVLNKETVVPAANKRGACPLSI